MTGFWALGVLTLLASVAFSLVFTTRYPTGWPWLSFIALAIFEDVLFGPVDARESTRLSPVVLVAAIIMFRKHPDLIMLIAVSATLTAGLLTRRPWFAILTRTSSWVIAGAAGAAAMRLVGYADAAHFVVATAVLILVYVAADAILAASLPTMGASGPVRAPARETLGRLGLAIGGALLALAWRTPTTGPIMLRLSEVCLLAVAGMAVGALLGGRPQELIRRRLSIRRLPPLVLAGALALAVSTRLPAHDSWIAATAGLLAIGAWAISYRWLPLACMLAGGLGNEIARGVNGGRMPVSTADLPAALQQDFSALSQHSSLYLLVDDATRLPWLADRFPLTPFPGIASPGDVLVGIGVVWLFAAMTLASRVQAARSMAAGRGIQTSTVVPPPGTL
jgi:hypothetical protein